MAKKPETKKSTTSKAKTAKAKPKTMPAKRARGVEKRTEVSKVGEIFRSIVDSVLSQKKVFTSEDIVSRTKSSPRHSRRTLAYLVKHNALSVNRSERPYRYQVASREQLKRLTK